MLTRSCSISVASSLQEMPGATSSHSGPARHAGAGTNGSSPVSAAIRRERASHSEGDGFSESAGDVTRTSIVGGNDVRCSNRRSIALDRARFMIHPTTEPLVESYVDAVRHTSWNTSSVNSSAVSQLPRIRMVHVKTTPYVCVYSAC